MNEPYVPLRVFSSFTMLEGAMEPKTIAERAAKLGFPAIAVTDRNGLYGVMPFSDACFAKGVQPIVGAMLAVRARRKSAARRASTGSCCWRRTIKAMPISASSSPRRTSTARSSRSRMSAFAKLDGLSEGLIALTAGAEGALARLIADGQQRKAEAYLDRLEPLFPEPALHRDFAARRSDRRGGGSRADRPRLCARPAAGRDQPGRLSRSVLPRGARCNAVHRQFGLCRKRRPSRPRLPMPG